MGPETIQSDPSTTASDWRASARLVWPYAYANGSRMP
jgi:hypothetical protein